MGRRGAASDGRHSARDKGEGHDGILAAGFPPSFSAAIKGSPEEIATIKARQGAPLCGWSLPFLIQTAVTLLGGALHLWTVLQLFRLGGGVVLSAAAFVLPVIAEIAVGALSYRAAGWGNPYCLALLVYGWLLLANWLGLVLLSDSSDYEK